MLRIPNSLESSSKVHLNFFHYQWGGLKTQYDNCSLCLSEHFSYFPPPIGCSSIKLPYLAITMSTIVYLLNASIFRFSPRLCSSFDKCEGHKSAPLNLANPVAICTDAKHVNYTESCWTRLWRELFRHFLHCSFEIFPWQTVDPELIRGSLHYPWSAISALGVATPSFLSRMQFFGGEGYEVLLLQVLLSRHLLKVWDPPWRTHLPFCCV